MSRTSKMMVSKKEIEDRIFSNFSEKSDEADLSVPQSRYLNKTRKNAFIRSQHNFKNIYRSRAGSNLVNNDDLKVSKLTKYKNVSQNDQATFAMQSDQTALTLQILG
jgi:uncharacterized protein YktA (UPF0223 family)